MNSVCPTNVCFGSLTVGGLLLLVIATLVLNGCRRTPDPQQAFAHARQTFINGDLLASQEEAESGYKKFLKSRPEWALKFRVLEAEVLMLRGMSREVLSTLDGFPSDGDDRPSVISMFTLRGMAHARLHEFGNADREIRVAEKLCSANPEDTCGEVVSGRGFLAIEQGRFEQAQSYFKQTLVFARAHNDRYLESTALLNLSVCALQQSHFDDAVDWSNEAWRLSNSLGANQIGQSAVGNLGWAYYELGDSQKALDSFLKAKRSAEELGDTLGQLIWLMDTGFVYLDRSDYSNAEQSFVTALNFAKELKVKEQIRNAQIPLAVVYERQGRRDEAIRYADDAIASARADGNRLDELYPLLVKGQVAAQLHDDQKAAAIFREVANDPQSDSSLKWEAQHSLARLEEDEGQRAPARREYEAALCTFETARSSVHHEESKLPFFTNAARIYDDYISFLIKSGQSRRALEVADYSRGRTLAEGLGLIRDERCAAPALNPERIATTANATILYYWLGQQQSYLWAITRSGVRNFVLPPAVQIDASVRRYREALVNGEDVVANSNTDGLQLYQQLVAPAIPLLQPDKHVRNRPTGGLSRTASGPQRLKPVSLAGSGGTAGSRALPNRAENSSNPGAGAAGASGTTGSHAVPNRGENSSNLGAGAAGSSGTAGRRAIPNPADSVSNLRLGTSAARVIVIPDGSLNSLNFETLLAPGNPAPHYWIEDATITNVQSLRLLAADKPLLDKHSLSGTEGNVRPTSKLLLVGDAVPHPPEYPALPHAEQEMQDIEKHFAPSAVTQYTQSSATAAAFLDSKPEQYSYIHFVAHAVASSQVPLDSAVILSPSGKDDSFKLYARDIIQHRLRARLVTVSACYGAGTRSYNGEGLIGLSWAFLRAGARNTIGALWEVNDASTPQLMDRFYAELQQGRHPDIALRDAKLALMHSSNVLSKPFYWAPFQLYGTS